jgi:hypothetical protein
MGQIRCEYNWHSTGRQVFYDGATFETLKAMFPVVYYDDFLGAGKVVVPAAGSAESGMDWVKKIVGAAPPTVAGAADAAGGVVQCALTSGSQKQDAGLYMDDQRNFDITKGLIFEARIKVTVIPTLVAEVIVGLVDDWSDGLIDSATYQISFNLDGAADIRCQSDDNATDRDADSGIDAATGTWNILRIDCTDVTDIKFFIDGAGVATGTTFPFAATGANAILQPYVGLYKASGAGVGTVQVDYVKIWQNRA